MQTLGSRGGAWIVRKIPLALLGIAMESDSITVMVFVWQMPSVTGGKAKLHWKQDNSDMFSVKYQIPPKHILKVISVFSSHLKVAGTLT